jgi:DNA-binding LytR/AlgR family response regulator
MNLNIAIYSTTKMCYKLHEYNDKYNIRNNRNNILKTTSEYNEICGEISSGINYDIVFIDLEMENTELLMEHIRASSSDSKATIILISPSELIPASVIKYKQLDCLVKKITYKDFSSHINGCESSMEKIYFTYHDGHHNCKIDISKIIYIKKQDQKLLIKTLDKSIIFRGRLCEYKDKESLSGFLNIHRACMVNLDHVIHYDNNKLTVTGNEELAVSRRKERIVRDHIFMRL